MQTQTINETIEREYRDYAMYVIGHRAIPSMIDGLKPVQRKIICSALKNAKNKKIKVAELGGGLSSFNYHHGEVSATSAVVGMAAPWSNNAPLLEAHGNFGSRLIQEPAAARYIFTKLSENYDKWFCDENIAPPMPDPEDPEPMFYLPIIPWVLVNGVQGIAVGFATNILPRATKDIANVCKKYLNGQRLPKHITPTYVDFTGTWEKIDDKWVSRGVVEKMRGSYEITELPVGYDREKYVATLNKMVDDGIIKDFDDKCGEFFRFSVKATPTQRKKIDKNPLKVLKLESSFTENLTVLDQNGDLKHYDSEIELIKDFCDYRLTMYQKRIDTDGQILASQIKEYDETLAFVKDINKNRKIALDKGRDYLLKRAQTHTQSRELVTRMVNMPVYKFCLETITELENHVKECKKELKILQALDSKAVFIGEL